MSSNPYIYGIHDPGGEAILNGRGWVVFTELVSEGGNDYRHYANQGLGVIVRLNHAYGPTLPPADQHGEFARQCAGFVAASRGCTTWVIGNEPNHEQEGRIPFDVYADGFNQAANAIRRVQPGATVCVAAVAPWNMAAGDWLFYFAQIVRLCHCDGIALHTYTHGSEPALIHSDEKMQSHRGRFYHFKAYRDFMAAIPANKRHLPVYITEADQDDPWANVNSGWVQNAYAEIHWWNQQPGNQQIRCLALYRWPNHDRWGFCDKVGVQDDLRAAVAKGYQWRADDGGTSENPKSPDQPATALKAGDTVTVVARSVNARNAPGLQADVALRLARGDSFVVESVYTVDGLIWLEGPHGWVAEVAPDGTRLVSLTSSLTGGAGVDGVTDAESVEARAAIVRRLAAEYGVDERLALAVIQIESGGAGFRDGRLVIRFEPHIYRLKLVELCDRLFTVGQPAWKGKFHRHNGESFHGNQDREYAALAAAEAILADAPYLACSFGAGQIMGFNHAVVGYPSARAMMAAFQASEEAQIRAVFQFSANKRASAKLDPSQKTALEHLREGNLLMFATIYNGPGDPQYYVDLIE